MNAILSLLLTITLSLSLTHTHRVNLYTSQFLYYILQLILFSVFKLLEKQELSEYPCLNSERTGHTVIDFSIYKFFTSKWLDGSMLSCFCCARLCETPWTAASQAPLSVGFSRQEYQHGLPCPSPGDLPNPGIEPRSPTMQVDSLSSEPTGKPKNTGVGSLSLLQGISPTQESNWGVLCCRQIIPPALLLDIQVVYKFFNMVDRNSLTQLFLHTHLVISLV